MNQGFQSKSQRMLQELTACLSLLPPVPSAQTAASLISCAALWLWPFGLRPPWILGFCFIVCLSTSFSDYICPGLARLAEVQLPQLSVPQSRGGRVS